MEMLSKWSDLTTSSPEIGHAVPNCAARDRRNREQRGRSINHPRTRMTDTKRAWCHVNPPAATTAHTTAGSEGTRGTRTEPTREPQQATQGKAEAGAYFKRARVAAVVGRPGELVDHQRGEAPVQERQVTQPIMRSGYRHDAQNEVWQPAQHDQRRMVVSREQTARAASGGKQRWPRIRASVHKRRHQTRRRSGRNTYQLSQGKMPSRLT